MDTILLEKLSVEKMISYYCHKNHKRDEKCPACTELVFYAQLRLDKCPHGQRKPVCSQCESQCYAAEKRGRIAEAMKFSAPMLVLCHPILAASHIRKSMSNKRSKERSKKMQIRKEKPLLPASPSAT